MIRSTEAARSGRRCVSVAILATSELDELRDDAFKGRDGVSILGSDLFELENTSRICPMCRRLRRLGVWIGAVTGEVTAELVILGIQSFEEVVYGAADGLRRFQNGDQFR